jgi:hypothetical protein
LLCLGSKNGGHSEGGEALTNIFFRSKYNFIGLLILKYYYEKKDTGAGNQEPRVKSQETAKLKHIIVAYYIFLM